MNVYKCSECKGWGHCTLIMDEPAPPPKVCVYEKCQMAKWVELK